MNYLFGSLDNGEFLTYQNPKTLFNILWKDVMKSSAKSLFISIWKTIVQTVLKYTLHTYILHSIMFTSSKHILKSLNRSVGFQRNPTTWIITLIFFLVHLESKHEEDKECPTSSRSFNSYCIMNFWVVILPQLLLNFSDLFVMQFFLILHSFSALFSKRNISYEILWKMLLLQCL